MKMKKMLAIFLSMAMIFALVACGAQKNQGEQAESRQESVAQTEDKFTIAFANSNASYPYMVKLHFLIG